MIPKLYQLKKNKRWPFVQFALVAVVLLPSIPATVLAEPVVVTSQTKRIADITIKGKVVDELEKGYTLNDKVIRFAKVVVGA